MKLTKAHVFLILACLAILALSGCMQVRPDSFTSFLTDLEDVDYEFNRGFKAKKVNQSKGGKILADAITGSIRDWLIAAVIERGIDSMDATTASDEALEKAKISADTEAAKIASAERIRLEELAMEAAEMEAAAAVVPVP